MGYPYPDFCLCAFLGPYYMVYRVQGVSVQGFQFGFLKETTIEGQFVTSEPGKVPGLDFDFLVYYRGLNTY